MTGFRNFCETVGDIGPFLAGHSDNWPSRDTLMVLADKLEEGGDSDLAELLRNLGQHTSFDPGSEQNAVMELWHKVVQSLPTGYVLSRHNIEIYADHRRVGYEWHGPVLARRTYPLSGAYARREIVDPAVIEDPHLLRALAALAAIQYFNASSHTGGLAPRSLHMAVSRSACDQMRRRLADTDENVLRQGMRHFLLMFTTLETRASEVERRRGRRGFAEAVRELENLLYPSRIGYGWDLNVTREFLSRYLANHPPTPFLGQLGSRLQRVLGIARSVDPSDDSVVSGLEEILALLTRRV